MESYEDFCANSLARLQAEMGFQMCPKAHEPQSVLRFYGRALLPPVLSSDERKAMAGLRQEAVRLDTERQNLCRATLLNPALAHNTAKTCESVSPPIQQKSPGWETGPAIAPPTICSSSGIWTDTEESVAKGSSPTVSLQNLLRRSREYLEKEQGRFGRRESLSDKENEAHSTHTQLQSSPSHGAPSTQDLIGTAQGSPVLPSGFLLCLNDGPHTHRRRPRPVSMGNDIFRDFPAEEREADPLPNWPGSLGGSVQDVPLGFRRRCYTLDSTCTAPPIDRNKERVPRIMGTQPYRAPRRRSPTAPPNRTYEVPLLRQQRSPDSRKVAAGTDEDQTTASLLGTSIKGLEVKTAGVQRQLQALEDVCRQLEQKHAATQLSLLIVEQEKDQQHLCQDLDEEGQVRDKRSPLSPAHVLLHSAEWSPGALGITSVHSSCVSSPAAHTPAYLWGAPSWSRDRLSPALNPELQNAICRLGALCRGFLTRRLLNTEKLKHLRQTVHDTQDFIQSFQTDSPVRKGSMSAQDIVLQERVRAQLRAALYDVYDIFFEMPLEERLGLLRQDRELRAERKLREMEKARTSKDRVALSAATQKALDRKKRERETPGPVRKAQAKSKSPPIGRILQPSQGQNAPAQLLRQGSLYRKTPEERLKRSESQKKRHSLG